MIYGLLHPGSGLGNQLHRYIATRCLAIDKNYEFGMVCPENFKGSAIMNLDMGEPFTLESRVEMPAGKVVVDNFSLWEEKSEEYNDKIHLVEDNTIIDGEFQDPHYFMHHLDEIREWLKVEEHPLQIPFTAQEDICVLNVRGGEYIGTSLFLPKEYWYYAMEKMKAINPKMRFGIVTDDVELCRQWFPNFYIRHDEHDWSAIRYAHYLILSNSSFAILPAILNQNVKRILAPYHWGGYNTGKWRMNQNQYGSFQYIHHND